MSLAEIHKGQERSVRIAANTFMGIALAVSFATCVKAAPMDYLTEFQAKQDALLKIREEYIMSGADMMLDQPNSQSSFLSSCYQTGVDALGQLMIVLSKVENLALVSKTAGGSSERDFVKPMLQNAVGLARATGTQTVKAIQSAEKVTLCQGSKLSTLGKTATDAVDSLEDTLTKMTE